MRQRGRPPEGAYLARTVQPPMKLSFEMQSLLERRTRPFLDSVGIERPIAALLQEAYLQGLRDALDALSARTTG